jgi:hypothetical protein
VSDEKERAVSVALYRVSSVSIDKILMWLLKCSMLHKKVL